MTDDAMGRRTGRLMRLLDGALKAEDGPSHINMQRDVVLWMFEVGGRPRVTTRADLEATTARVRPVARVW